MLSQLKKLLSGNEREVSHNGVTFSNTDAGVGVTVTGLFVKPTEFILNKTQLNLLKGFLTLDTSNHEHDVFLVKLDGAIRLAVENDLTQTSLDLREDGSSSVFSGWGSMDYWDRWEVSPTGTVHYTGTVDGYRITPEWLDQALERVRDA